jgi:hypothetical protein
MSKGANFQNENPLMKLVRPERIVVPICDWEAQKVFKIENPDLHKHLRLAHLLASYVVISPSFVFESKHTETFYRRNSQLIKENQVLVSMKEDEIDEFIENKQVMYAPLKLEYPGYFNPGSLLQLLRDASPLKRQGQIVRTIETHWTEQLQSDYPLSLRSELFAHIQSEPDARRLIDHLLVIPQIRSELPFTWEVLERFVSPVLQELADTESKKVRRCLRYRLLAFYFKSLAQLSNSSIVSFSDYRRPRLDEQFLDSRTVSINTFDKALRAMGIDQIIYRLKDWQIIEEKFRPEYLPFIESYFQIVEGCAGQNNIIDSILRELEHEKARLNEHCLQLIEEARQNQNEDLVAAIRDCLSSHIKYLPVDIYEHPLLSKIVESVPLIRYRDSIVLRYTEALTDRARSFKEEILYNLPKRHSGSHLLQPTRLRKERYVTRRRVFISYSHKDENIVTQIVEHLKVLERFGNIEIWHDRNIIAGDLWREKVENALKKANIALFMVSKSFLNSQFCQDIEVRKLLQRYGPGYPRIVPIIIRSCIWKADPVISRFEVLPKDGKPVASFRGDTRDAVITDICEVISAM